MPGDECTKTEVTKQPDRLFWFVIPDPLNFGVPFPRNYHTSLHAELDKHLVSFPAAT